MPAGYSRAPLAHELGISASARRCALTKLGAAAVTLLVAPLELCAQQASTQARIGYLSPLSARADARNRAGFAEGLRALGYVEGKTVIVEARHADGNLERLGELAAEIVRLDVAVIVAATTPAVAAARRAAPNTPIVMAFAGDPTSDGLIASLARPGGTITGLSAAVSEIAAKRVEFLRAIVPKASRFVLLTTPEASKSMVTATQRAGTRLGVDVRTVRVRDAGDAARALSGAVKEKADGVIVDLALGRNAAQIVEEAMRHRLPTASGPREFAVSGGLLAYGANYPDLFRRSAAYVDRILRGAKPGELPVEQPTRFELVVNLGTARLLGLTVPEAVLARADEVIR